MRAMLAVVVLGLGASALAERKTLVVGAGDCRDTALLGSVRDFQELTRGLLRNGLFEHDEVLNRVRPQPTRSLEDLQRQVETARSLLYNGQNERALEVVRDALAGLERASPEVGPWPTTAEALMLLSQLEKNLDHPKESTEAFRRILRVDPMYRANADAWPPSTIRAVDAVRKDLQRSKRAVFEVTSSTGPGAQVFLDGRDVGKTPLRLELPLGAYRLALMAQGEVSFPRVVNLVRDDAVQVDLAFEGSLMAQVPLCLNGEDARALRLAMAVDADRLVVLRNAAQKGNPFYVNGLLYDVDRGERVRNAGIRPEQLRDLMLYLFTGKPDISRGGPPTEVSRVEPSQQASSTAGPPPPPPPLVESSRPMSLGRVLSFVALGVGVAAGVGGGVLYAVGDAARSDFALTKRSDGRLPDSGSPVFATSIDLMTSIDRNQAASFTLMGVGAGAIAAGLVGLLMYPATTSTVAVLPTPSGASLAFSGSF